MGGDSWTDDKIMAPEGSQHRWPRLGRPSSGSVEHAEDAADMGGGMWIFLGKTRIDGLPALSGLGGRRIPDLDRCRAFKKHARAALTFAPESTVSDQFHGNRLMELP